MAGSGHVPQLWSGPVRGPPRAQAPRRARIPPLFTGGEGAGRGPTVPDLVLGGGLPSLEDVRLSQFSPMGPSGGVLKSARGPPALGAPACRWPRGGAARSDAQKELTAAKNAGLC